jgi:hypothetical protein
VSNHSFNRSLVSRMKARLRGVGFLGLLAVVVLIGGLCLPDTQAEETAYATVKSASHFAIGGVGVAGIVSQEELAMRQIRDGPQAEAQLRQLLREATPAGQMYALFALRQLDLADYATLSATYRQSSTPVPTISGCNIHTQPISQAVNWIDQYASKMRAWERTGPSPKTTR